MEDIVPTERPQQHSLWVSLVEAVRGSHQDYTRGSLNRAILLLAVPMVLEMVLESLFAVVDVFWVGRLGANAIATVGLSESLLSLVFSVGMGLSLSTTAMVAILNVLRATTVEIAIALNELKWVEIGRSILPASLNHVEVRKHQGWLASAFAVQPRN